MKVGGKRIYSSFPSVFTGNTISQTPFIGVLEESVTLPLKFPAEEETQSITWLHNGTSIIFIQPKEALIQVTDPKRKDRLKVTQSYSLQIKNLTMADTGLYRAQITTMTSSVISDYSLRIFSESELGVKLC